MSLDLNFYTFQFEFFVQLISRNNIMLKPGFFLKATLWPDKGRLETKIEFQTQSRLNLRGFFPVEFEKIKIISWYDKS